MKTELSTRFILTFLLVGLLLVGCGYDPEQPVYDTRKNPNNFPPQAISLIDGVESGRLADYATITDAFADLYSDHFDLLDNQDWSKVITKLGSKFRLKADSLSELGISYYSNAAGFYQLATFANPVSGRAARRAEAFGIWRKAVENGEIDLSALEDSTFIDIKAILDASRHFLLTDSLHQMFYHDYLSFYLEKRLKKTGQLTPEALETLTPADRALVKLARLSNEPITKSIATFADTTIALVAIRVAKTDSTQFSAEVYLVPRHPIHDKITAILRLGSKPLTEAGKARQTNFTQIDLIPVTPASSWKDGDIVAFAGSVSGVARVEVVSMGLFDCSSEPGEYLKPDGFQDNFIQLDSTVLQD